MPSPGTANPSPKVVLLTDQPYYPADLYPSLPFRCYMVSLCDFAAAASTKEIILGTETGQLFEMAVDEADKKEKYVKLLFELTELQEGIKDLQVWILATSAMVQCIHLC
jgi:hypothetical protein